MARWHVMISPVMRDVAADSSTPCAFSVGSFSLSVYTASVLVELASSLFRP